MPSCSSVSRGCLQTVEVALTRFTLTCQEMFLDEDTDLLCCTTCQAPIHQQVRRLSLTPCDP